MSDLDELRRIAAELEQLNTRLDGGELTAAQATELLEEITQLAQAAAEAVERRAEALEE
jgi:hypothetical protein